MTERRRDLDALRGAAMAAMVIVNNPGSWKDMFPILKHAAWNGLTAADLVFPFFLFASGMSAAISLSKRRENQTSASLAGKILIRVAVLILLGLFLNAFPRFDPAHLRFTGILQRLAIVYLFTAPICLLHGMKFFRTGLSILILVLFVVYGSILLFLTFPGQNDSLSPTGNFPSFIDHLILADHMYRAPTDPEGIVSTLGSLTTMLCGSLFYFLLNGSDETSRRKIAAGSLLFLVAGAALIPLFPVNKNLWTPSFTLLTASLAALVFFAFEQLDQTRAKFTLNVFVFQGKNALVLYFLSSLLGRFLYYFPVGVATGQSYKAVIYQTVFAPFPGGALSSLFYSLVYLAFWMLFLWLLNRKKIYIKL